MGIRQINFSTSGELAQDLITKEYVDNWEENYPDADIDPKFLDGKLEPYYWMLNQSLGFRTTNEMNFGYSYAAAEMNELTGKYQTFRQGFNISSPKSGRLQKFLFGTGVNWGTFYNFAQKYVGSSSNINWNNTIWLKSNMGLELNGNYIKTFDPAGTMDGRHFRVSMRNTYLFTKDFFVRLYTQGRWGVTYYDEKRINNTYLLSFLLGWEFNPGCWFYLAFNEGREDINAPDYRLRNFGMTDRTLLTKIYYVIQ